MRSLNTRAWLALALLAVVMGILLFVSAGTMHYWQAWVYLTIFIGASLLTTIYLMKKDPALLRRRMRGGPNAACAWLVLGAPRTRGHVAISDMAAL